MLKLARGQGSLFLLTDARSAMAISPKGVITLVGFLDAASAVLPDFSETLDYRDGILTLVLNNHQGTIQRIPLVQVNDTPDFRSWLADALKLIP